MAFDWSINGYPPLFMRLFAWLLIAHWELLILLSLIHAWLLYSFEALTCWLYWLILLTILIYWLSLLYDYSAHLDTYILLVAYLVHFDMIDSLGCILSWLSCRFGWYIPILRDCMVHDYSLSTWCMYCLSDWVSYLSLYFQFSSLSRTSFPWSRISYELSCFVCSSAELVIWNKV